MWGKHVIIDMSAGDKARVRSATHIRRFVETLVETIGMKAYGPPVLEHFAEHVPEAAGYSLVQLIETSARKLPSNARQHHRACASGHSAARRPRRIAAE
jgi:hypothetical protein